MKDAKDIAGNEQGIQHVKPTPFKWNEQDKSIGVDIGDDTVQWMERREVQGQSISPLLWSSKLLYVAFCLIVSNS